MTSLFHPVGQDRTYAFKRGTLIGLLLSYICKLGKPWNQARSFSSIGKPSFALQPLKENRMFKRIVVAIDGSRTSRRAFESALELAATHGAVLQPYYVVENAPVYYDVPGYDPSVLRDELANQGTKLADEANAEMKQRGVQGAVVIAEGSSVDDVAEMVLAAAAAFNADLLVMGTHGRKGFQRLILGSVAERCLRQATLPVLLIPAASGTGAVPESKEE
jgi:nucleotide-binding universal stress UspA family protein